MVDSDAKKCIDKATPTYSLLGGGGGGNEKSDKISKKNKNLK
jgi:hypothetical protein